MWFLTEHGTPWKPWPMNFVGNVTEIKEDLFQILMAFLWNGTMSEKEAREEFESQYLQGRDRHSSGYVDGMEQEGGAKLKGDKLQKYQLEVGDLEDDEVRRICELYWMDYICIPFPVPKACNLTELLLRHYGNDVVYKDCWEYETQEWDTEFVDEYKNTTFNEKKQGSKKKSRKRKKGETSQNGAKRKTKGPKGKRKRHPKRGQAPKEAALGAGDQDLELEK